MAYYQGFESKGVTVRNDFPGFLADAKNSGLKAAAYGAAARGNTLLNYCGVKDDIIEFVLDASPHKQGKLLPGSHIQVVSEERIRERKPDYMIVFPWNIRDEIMDQLNYVREWGCRFVIAIPELMVL
jgi:hypothetical protein